jgi:hypothetical protein
MNQRRIRRLKPTGRGGCAGAPTRSCPSGNNEMPQGQTAFGSLNRRSAVEETKEQVQQQTHQQHRAEWHGEMEMLPLDAEVPRQVAEPRKSVRFPPQQQSQQAHPEPDPKKRLPHWSPPSVNPPFARSCRKQFHPSSPLPLPETGTGHFTTLPEPKSRLRQGFLGPPGRARRSA